LAKKNNKKAIKIIRRAADINGVELSQRILTSFGEDLENNDVNLLKNF
jgi:hypothetical protein